jgi:hypothetical protein
MNKNLKFVIRSRNHKSTITVVGITDSNNILKVGVTKCSTKDTFVKKTGVYVAEQRAIKKPSMEIDLNIENHKKPYHIFKDYAQRIFNDVNSYVEPKNNKH